MVMAETGWTEWKHEDERKEIRGTWRLAPPATYVGDAAQLFPERRSRTVSTGCIFSTRRARHLTLPRVGDPPVPLRKRKLRRPIDDRSRDLPTCWAYRSGQAACAERRWLAFHVSTPSFRLAVPKRQHNHPSSAFIISAPRCCTSRQCLASHWRPRGFAH